MDSWSLMLEFHHNFEFQWVTVKDILVHLRLNLNIALSVESNHNLLWEL